MNMNVRMNANFLTIFGSIKIALLLAKSRLIEVKRGKEIFKVERRISLILTEPCDASLYMDIILHCNVYKNKFSKQ